jgi:hypothetical protein
MMFKFRESFAFCTNGSIKKHRIAAITDNFFLYVGVKLHTSLSSAGRLSTTPLPPKNPRPIGQYGTTAIPRSLHNSNSQMPSDMVANSARLTKIKKTTKRENKI